MLMHWLFEKKRSDFLSKRNDLLNLIEELKKQNDKSYIELEKKFNWCDQTIQKLSNHFASGKNCLQNFTFWTIFRFWQKTTDLEKALMSWPRALLEELYEIIFYVLPLVFIIKRFWFALYVVPTGSAEPNYLVGDRIVGIKYAYLFSQPQRGDLVIIEDPKFHYSSNIFAKAYQKYVGFPLLGLPQGPECWTKRVIGLPGDKVELKADEHGKPGVWVNRQKLNEPYLNPYPVIYLSNRKAGIIDRKNPLLRLPLIGFAANFFGLIKQNTKPMFYTFDPSKPYNEQPYYNFEDSEIYKDPVSGKPLIKYPDLMERHDRIYEFTVPKGHIFLLGDNRKNSHDGRSWGVAPLDIVLGRASVILFSVDGNESYWFVDFIKTPIRFFTHKLRRRFLRFTHPFKEIPKN